MVELQNSSTDQSNSFFGYQLIPGYFSSSKIKIKLTINSEERSISYQRIDKSNKQARRVFKISEVHQVVVSPADLNNQGKSTIKQKSLSFIFKDRAIDLFTCFIEKPVFEQLKIAMNLMANSEHNRVHMLFIKQDRPPQKNQNSINYIKQKSYKSSYCQQPNFLQLQTYVLHTTLDNGIQGIQYSVSVQKQNQSFKRVIIVYQADQNASIIIFVQDTKETYELISWNIADEWDSHRVEVSLSGQGDWLLDFQSAFKSLQFQEQVKVYQTAQIYRKQTQLQNTEMVTYVEIPVRILAVTHNMARTHQDVDFGLLFPDPQKYSLIVWGVQECSMNEKEMQVNQLRAYLGEDFIQVGYKEMWEMFLVVFVHVGEVNFVANVQSKYYATGVMNYVGNKGGLLLQFYFYDRLFCFINCHLPSGADKAEKRMDHLANILKNLSCVKSPSDKIEADAAAEFSLILGDLNSRFKSTYSKHIAKVKNSRDMIDSLDELYEGMHINNYLHGYYEDKIHFDPTYKRAFQDNSTYINKKDQCPSYTDRILFKTSKEAFQPQLNSYSSNDEVLGSDHRPVSLDLSLCIKSSHLLEPRSLLDQSQPDQGYGQLRQKFVSLRFSSKALTGLKRKLSYPVHIQMQYRASWLCESPFSFEKRFDSAGDNFQIKFWKEQQLPILLTPINSQFLLQNKKLLIVIKIREAQSSTQENFAYCCMEMHDSIKTTGDSSEQNITTSGAIVGFNKVLGHFDASMEFQLHKSGPILDTSGIQNEADLFETEDECVQNPSQTQHYNDFVQFC